MDRATGSKGEDRDRGKGKGTWPSGRSKDSKGQHTAQGQRAWTRTKLFKLGGGGPGMGYGCYSTTPEGCHEQIVNVQLTLVYTVS